MTRYKAAPEYYQRHAFVMKGSKDRLLLPSQAEVARRQLPHARHLPLPGCGHVPMTDDPALVAQVLLDGSTLPANAEPAAAEPTATED